VLTKKTIALTLTLMATACGYHLRGASGLPKGMSNLYLEGGSPILREQFETTLKSASGHLVASSDKADIVVRIYNDEITRRTLSLSGRGRSNDLELAGHVEFEVIDPKSGMLVSREPVDFRREYFNDQQDVIAKDHEETVIKKEMYQQAVRTIINRSRMALDNKGK
jgi:LPS-assembly lipoprotein